MTTIAMGQPDRTRIQKFLQGEEISISTAREMVHVLLHWHDEQVRIAADALTRTKDVLDQRDQAHMNLRDQFASAALVHAMTSEDGEQAARDAYRIADAMLKVRVG